MLVIWDIGGSSASEESELLYRRLLETWDLEKKFMRTMNSF